MKKAILLPRKYIQGRGLISEIGAYAAILGKKAVVLWGATTKKTVGEAVLASLKAAGVEYTDVHFNGECTKEEADRVAGIAKNGHESVIGIGGGKVIDAAKAVAIYAKLPHIIVPTVASNDSPTSACTVWYDDHGVMTGFDLWPSNPDYILVDTQVIANAPIRYLKAGIGDAMATWFEAEASYASRAVTCSGGIPTMTAMAMAKLCYETLKEYGLSAIESAKVHAVTPALEKVVEASVLLSGIGWESGGLATAHGVGNGLPALPETHELLHGEKVAFGIMTQLCIDDSLPTCLVEETAEFLVRVGLPVTFEEVHLDKVSPERLKKWAEDFTGPGNFVHNHNFKVCAGDLYDALFAADALGKKVKACLGKCC
ncbi:MAG: glycerol dehydrogenase [Spirochaetaceae bacterium]|jgi:glycerol dehydrogenase|nr:glycerol dehydrogenase [Spirochaetaceae bacterium]